MKRFCAGDMASAAAQSSSALAGALYSEYVRQAEAAREEARWQAQMAYQRQQDALAQANWERQFQYGQQTDQRESAYSLASALLKSGIMPDSGTLAAAGISAADAQSLAGAYRTAGTAKSGGSGGAKSGGGAQDYSGLFQAAQTVSARSSRPTMALPKAPTGTRTQAQPQDLTRTSYYIGLQNQARLARADLDMDTLNRLNGEMKDLRAASGKQTLGDRASDTVSGTIQSYAGSLVNGAGTVVNAFQDPEYNRRQIARMQKDLARGRSSDGRVLTATQRQTIQEAMQRLADEAWQLERPGSLTNRIYRLADQMQDEGARSIAKAKDGLGTGGQLAVDLAVAGGQMGLDVLAATATGGSALVPMAARSFGGAAQEARRAGADLDGQLLYGAGSAVISAGTEKISNIAAPFKRIYGAGGAETIARSLVKKFGQNRAVQLMQNLSGTAAGRIVLSAIGEGGEEVVEDVLQPFLKRATYDPEARFDIRETEHDALIGAILGGFGGSVEAVGNTVSRYGQNQTGKGAGAPRVTETVQSALEAPTMVIADMGKKPRMTMADFTNPESPVWNNVEYDDVETQAAITKTVHKEMVEAGEIVRIPDSTIRQTAEAYPDLRSMKKVDRNPILRQKVNTLKASLRQFLDGMKGTGFEFEVNGNMLEAWLYNTGIQEVMGKIKQDKASMLYHSDEIFRNAKYLYSTPDYDGDPNVYRWNYFYSPVQIGNDVVGVRIAVRDISEGLGGNPESQIYNWGIKKGSALSDGRPPLSVASSGASLAEPFEGTRPLNSNITIAQGAEFVKLQGTGGPDIAAVYLRQMYEANLREALAQLGSTDAGGVDIAAAYLRQMYEADLGKALAQLGGTEASSADIAAVYLRQMYEDNLREALTQLGIAEADSTDIVGMYLRELYEANLRKDLLRLEDRGDLGFPPKS